MIRIRVLHCSLALLACVCARETRSDDFVALRQQVESIGDLTNPPSMYPVSQTEDREGLREIYFDALPYQGKPTRVFAWLGMPTTAQATDSDGQFPGVVLVHGGGGSAFKEWVQKWNENGFAAISIAVEGQTDQREEQTKQWFQHEWAGPKRNGIYGDSDQPLADQWMYHAVADTVLANSLLRSLPNVDKDRVGVMGISWGGIITSTVIGIDDRFAFAIPTYGCGNLATAANQYGRSLGDNELYKQVWDPMVRMQHATMPTLWLSWPGDQHFPLDKQAACYRAMAGDTMVCLIPGMRHGHGAGWNPPDSYAFANSVVRQGAPWCHQTTANVSDQQAVVSFHSSKKLDDAVLVSTTDTGVTGSRKWTQAPAQLTHQDDTWQATSTLPAGTTAWFINAHSKGLTVSSEYQSRDWGVSK
ncbi:acetylxylan esterase [Stieleria sp. TO1_6]|uniref:alpha/beta hydrolase family protein n=1 Tax=Stieleria tagensis TaxID=2956795 RepID=UPI00209BB338|nr:acetylxylan esterase [Stieleria tagensis]MCO8124877.1 acetylxylan esterase [Stieleria tagensis]